MAYVWHIWYSGHLMLSLYDLRGTYSRNSLVSTLSACQGWCGLLSQVSKVEGQELLPPGWEVEFFLDRLMWKHTKCSSKRTYCSWGGSCCLSLSVTSNAVQQGQAMSSVCNECKSLYIQLMAKLVLYGRFWCSMEMFLSTAVFKPVVLIDVNSSSTSAFSLFLRPNLAGKCRTPISTIEGTCICPSGPDCEGLAQVVSKCIKGIR